MNRSPSPARWQALEPLLDDALALPDEHRAPFVAAACAGDIAMRDELMAMLTACERFAGDDGFLAWPAAERYAALWEEPMADERFANALAERYGLEEEIGRGGMAVVYRALDGAQQRRVALKVLRQTVGEREAKRFRREIELATRLRHPNIVSVLDAGESAGRLWYTMPLIDGETLGTRLRRVERFEIPDAVRVLRAIADALSYAHDHGVIHRDLKPDNVLLEGDRVIVADFGVAKAVVAASESGSSVSVDERGTTAGVRVGTPLYMAPEQIAGDVVIDHRADLYALGIVAYQLITGTPPFAPESRQALVAAHLAEEPPPMASRRGDVPPELEHLIMRLLAKQAAERPGSAAKVRAELETMFPSEAARSETREHIEAAVPDQAVNARAGTDDSHDAEQLPTFDVIADRYRIDRQISAGGMATVFLAEDLKHRRRVAVKVLHPSLAHTIGVQRFLREIEVVARLQHPHLLTLIDSGDVLGLPYYVMPYVEAQSLRETIAAHRRLSFADAIRIAQEVADGLAYAHRSNIVHRDIKPSNILMSGGHAVVADFGIATAVQRATVGRLTGTGMSLGSPTYMSPEQAAGERDVDGRSDVYSLACVLYEMLAGEPPIDGASMQDVVTRKLTDRFTPLRERRADVPPSLEAAVHRAMSADRTTRFATVEEFSRAISLPVVAPTVSRRVRLIGAAAGIALVIASSGGVFWFRHERAVTRATQEVAEVSERLAQGRFASAFELAEQIRPVIPNDSTLRRMRPFFTDFLKIATAPAGARVSIQRIDQPDSAWQFIGETPILGFPVAKTAGLHYRVRIERSGYEPRELLGALFTEFGEIELPPGLDTLRLDSLGTHPGLLRIPGEIRNGKRLADYFIGRTEVTNRDYARFVAAGGYTKREYWTEPMFKDRRPVSWEQAVAEFKDRSGSAGPSTWVNGTYPPGQEDFPVSGVSYYEAAAYARFVGLRLPTNAHWRRAATFLSPAVSWVYLPTSNLNSAQPRRVGGGAANVWGLYDVMGNVREWCVNAVGDGRLALGGGWEDAEWLTGNTIWKPPFDRSVSNGFRLVALTDPESTIAALSRPVKREFPLEFRDFKAVPDAKFAAYQRMFDYDRRPLDARVVETGDRGQFRWELVSFVAPYGAERMLAYIYLPKNAAPPFEPVILWPPGSPAWIKNSFIDGALFETITAFIPQSGRALVLPVFKGSPIRDDTLYINRRLLPDTTIFYRDLSVQWVKDMRRTIDYLETRFDMKADRVGFYGVSWGGLFAPLPLAMEPRIKAAVLRSAGYYVDRPTRAEVDPANYAPRVVTPTLMLGGEHDNTMFPYTTSQAPFFRQLGTPAADKKRIGYESSHFVPLEDGIRETLAWFDHYLSGRNVQSRSTPARQ